MKENGMLLYSKNYLEEKEKKYDDNILIGFFASLVNFGREAMHTIIQYLDLGHDNKLILLSKSEEKLLAAAIVGSIDDNDLIKKILQNIMQDFISAFSPEYNPDEINIEEVEEIIEDNLKGKISRSLIQRLFFSLLLLIPLSIFLNILNLMTGEAIAQDIYLEEDLYTSEEIYTEIMPAMVLISLFILLIVFVLPNLISGYLCLNIRVAFINSIIYIFLVVIIYFYLVESVFAYVILFYMPLVLIISITCAYIGFKLASKRKIVK
ncbi:MAG: hypothetical protein ACFFAN_05880 [Promethearchaeota archaeon]